MKKDNINLTIQEAYKSMVNFLEKYYQRTNSDDIGGLLGDIMLIDEGITADPASWDDWLESVERIKSEKYIEENGKRT
ncbi:hypothetical protein [Clostridium beijerinckii]|uniref:hypothetical protein n=1 Tax=Clostridium beijerinckii TaxID=1520 RepID=UPI0009CEE4D2|nr:hypothetical protein [Clostridium beijerinckii]NRT79461.1 hypothetical protein [Clostridium beijerinckii]OOM41529.1 hypothetical protein CBEIJ_44590 [Clostridium beijerinckii]